MNRRSFFSRAGALAAGAACALYIPSDRLAFGVPRASAVASEPLRLWSDGIHDDTAAIQAMLDKGGVVQLPSGVYRTVAPLAMRSNTIFDGSAGVHIRYEDSCAIRYAPDVERVVIQGMTFTLGPGFRRPHGGDLGDQFLAWPPSASQRAALMVTI